MPIRIAIDGYSSCGKSTIAKALAKQLGYTYIDTGAMYRAVTLYFMRNKIDLYKHTEVIDALKNIHIQLSDKDGKSSVLLNNEDVSAEIRQMPVSENVSKISAIKEVRDALVKQQKAMGRLQNVVMDGRDIGTIVFPDAQLKLFMTANPDIRAERRFKELTLKGEFVTFEEILENIEQRDLEDTTRAESPLTQADDAIVLDNSHLNQAEQLEFVIGKLRKLGLE